MTTTIFTEAADDQGRFNASFLLPIDLDESDEPVVTVVVTSNAAGASAAAPFLLAIATTMPTPLTPTTSITPTVVTPTPETPTSTPLATATPAQTATPRPANVGQVTSAGLNLRTGPSVAYTVIRALPTVPPTVFGRNAAGDWLYVRLANGAEGWLAGRFTDFTGTAPILATPPAPAPPTATPVQPPNPCNHRIARRVFIQ